MHKDGCSNSGTANSFSVGSTIANSLYSISDSLEEMNSIVSSCSDHFDYRLKEYLCCIQILENRRKNKVIKLQISKNKLNYNKNK